MSDTTRWRVRQCPECATIWPVSLTICQTYACAHWLDHAETFDVVRVTGARSKDPSTSKLAALANEPRLGTKRRMVFEVIRRYGPLTAREACGLSGIPDGWKRVSELQQGGHLRVVAERLDPETNKQVQVYEAAAAANGQLFE